MFQVLQLCQRHRLRTPLPKWANFWSALGWLYQYGISRYSSKKELREAVIEITYEEIWLKARSDYLKMYFKLEKLKLSNQK